MTTSLINWQAMLADAGTAAGTTTVMQPNPTAGTIQSLGMMALFGVMAYMMIIRPQSKKAKAHAELLKTLRSGDKIVTSSGIVGVVISVKDKVVSIRSADAKLELLKSAVTEIEARTPAGASGES